MGFRLTAEAEADIVAIAAQGIALFGPQQARLYHDELFDVFALIAANPKIARERVEISPPVRAHPHKAHLIIYLVEENGEVLIVRVRHGHEDWE